MLHCVDNLGTGQPVPLHTVSDSAASSGPVGICRLSAGVKSRASVACNDPYLSRFKPFAIEVPVFAQELLQGFIRTFAFC